MSCSELEGLEGSVWEEGIHNSISVSESIVFECGDRSPSSRPKNQILK